MKRGQKEEGQWAAGTRAWNTITHLHIYTLAISRLHSLFSVFSGVAVFRILESSNFPLKVLTVGLIMAIEDELRLYDNTNGCW